jgi:Fe-S-cluster-containing dehydrogenase component
MKYPTSLAIDTRKCTACRACELACHYHHSGVFGTTENSVTIEYQPDSGNLNISINETCDECGGEILPFCVKYCAPRAIQLR